MRGAGLAFVFIKLAEVLMGTFLQPVQVSVSGSPALQCISHGHHIGQFLLHCQWYPI